MYLRNRVKGRNKTQDLWDATPHKVIRQLDTGNTYVVVPLVALPGEEDSRKTVHMNDILHATQLADDMGFGNSPVVSQDRSRDDIYSSNELMEAGSGNGAEETRSEEGSDDGEKDDDFELVVLRNQSSVPKDIPNGSDAQQVLSDDLGQSQSETPGEDSAKSDRELQITAELAADAVADPKTADTLQTSTSGHEGAEVTPATDDTKSSPSLGRSTRAGAGQHSNPQHLPRPVMKEGNATVQSSLLIMQLLAKNAQV